MSRPREKWEKFFRACGLPSSVSANYSGKFVKERIQPYMLRDLQKEHLTQLGIEALGDQLAILKHIRDNFGNSLTAASKTIDYEDAFEDEGEEMYEIRPSKAPDRHDVYQIKMPAGNTARTRSILEKQEELRKKGLLKRGTSGKRIGGVDLTTSKVSEASKTIRKKPIMSADISSTTALIHSKMRSDQIIAKEAIKHGVGGANMMQRALVSTIEDPDNTNFRVRLDVSSTTKSAKSIRKLNAIIAEQGAPAPQVRRKPIYIAEQVAPPPPIRRKPITQRVKVVEIAAPPPRKKPITQRIQLVAQPAQYAPVHRAAPVQARVTRSKPSIADRLSLI